MCTLVCRTMLGHFDNSNLIMVYLLGVAAVAVWHGRGPSVLAACMSVAAFDFFFVPPHLTFVVADTQYVVTFAVMLVVGLLISTLAVRVRDQAEAAHDRERRTHLLYAMSRELASPRVPEEIARVACRHIAEVLRGSAEIFLPGMKGGIRAVSSSDDALSSDVRDLSVAQWVFDHGHVAGLGTDLLPGASALYLPLRTDHGTLGVLGVRPHESLHPLSPDQLRFVETLAQQTVAPLERARLSTEAEQARVEAESERLRSTLLSSISHDLRTPLAAIMGSASSLLQRRSMDDHAKQELTEAIYEEAERLSRLVTNLLDMTRLESDSLKLNHDWHSVEEIVSSALARSEAILAGRRVETHISDDLPLVSMDAMLVEQVLVNLLDNASKYTDPGTEILIAARREDNQVLIEVSDEGQGLAPGSEELIFEKFYRGSRGEKGFGLGLSICRAIVNAHGGRIWADNKESAGAVFRFTLPLGEPPALEAPPDEESVGD